MSNEVAEGDCNRVIYCVAVGCRPVYLPLQPHCGVILYLQNETKIARNRYLRKRTEAVKDKDYKLSLVL